MNFDNINNVCNHISHDALLTFSGVPLLVKWLTTRFDNFDYVTETSTHLDKFVIDTLAYPSTS